MDTDAKIKYALTLSAVVTAIFGYLVVIHPF